MRTTTQHRAEPQLNEIDGYLELGMEAEALGLIRATLTKKDISAEEFNTCIFALLRIDEPESWRGDIETAYGRLSGPVNDEVRSAMLNYCFTVREPVKALEFFPRRRTRFFDAWTMMQVCLELGRLDRAKKIARLCINILATADDDFIKASMSDALAAYYLRIGEWQAALTLWNQAPDEPAFQRQRLCGIVKVHLTQALEATRAGLASVVAKRQRPDLRPEIQLPGNAAVMLDDTESELKHFEQALEKLLAAEI